MKPTRFLIMPDTAKTGVPPINAVVYDIPLTENSVTGTQAMETLAILGQREGSDPTFGTLKPSGSIGSPVTGDFAPFIMATVFGKALTTAPATTDVWATATLYDYGDIINHTDGLHSLICVVAGTSGATEPSLAAYPLAFDGRGVELTDGTVKWSIQPKKIKTTYKTGDCIPPFTIEVERGDGCVGGTSIYEKFVALRTGQLDMTFAGGDLTILKVSLPVEGEEVKGTVLDAAYTSISTVAGVTVRELLLNSFSKDQCTMIVDGSASTALNLTDFGITINNNLNSADLIGGNKSYVSIGSLEAKGSASGFIANGNVLAFMQKLANHGALRVEILIHNKNTGDSINIVVPKNIGSYPKIEDTTASDSKFMAEIAASKGGTENTTFYVEVVSSVEYAF